MTTHSVINPYLRDNGPLYFDKKNSGTYTRVVLTLLGYIGRDLSSWETKKERMVEKFMEHVEKFRQRMSDALIVETYKDLTPSEASFDIV